MMAMVCPGARVMLPRHGHGGVCASLHSCRRIHFAGMAFMLTYTVCKYTLDWRKHAWMIFVGMLFLLHATAAWG